LEGFSTMGKALIVLFTIILITGGVFGTYYFMSLNKAESEINEAIIEIKEGNYEIANSILKEVLSQYHHSVIETPAAFLLGESYRRSGKYATAFEIYIAILTNNSIPSKDIWYIHSALAVSKLYRQGLISLSKGRTEIIEDYLQVILVKLGEENWIGYTDIDTLRNRMRRLLYSTLSFQYNYFVKDLSRRALRADIETELGFLYLFSKKYKQAEEMFLKSSSPLSKFGLARVYLETGVKMKGIVLLEELIRNDTSGRILKYYLQEAFDFAEKLYEEKNYAEAVALFKSIFEKNSKTLYSELTGYYLAVYFYNNDNYSISLGYLNDILNNSLPQKDEESHLLKGFIFYDKRDFIGALKIFRDFIKTYPDSTNVHTAKEWEAMCERSIKYLG
jgi:TolA-binding protein